MGDLGEEALESRLKWYAFWAYLWARQDVPSEDVLSVTGLSLRERDQVILGVDLLRDTIVEASAVRLCRPSLRIYLCF